MPPKAISRAAWTTPERIGAVIVAWTVGITLLSVIIIIDRIVRWIA